MALTQEEIDALLSAGTASGPAAGQKGLTDQQRQRLIAYGEQIAESAGSVFSQMSGQTIHVSVDNLADLTGDEVDERVPQQAVLVVVDYTEGFKGRCLMLWDVKDATSFTNQIAGAMGMPTEDPLGEAGQSILAEATSTLFGTAATPLASRYGTPISTSPPVLHAIAAGSAEMESIVKAFRKHAYAIDLSLNIAENNCTLMLTEELYRSIAGVQEGGSVAAPPPKPARGGAAPARTPAVQPVVFEEFGGGHAKSAPANLELILGINLEVRVELGRTHMKVKDILELGSGSVIELDKLAGEPVDLFVNNQLFARGEVIVIDENFGIRITDIVNVERRIEALR